jgi:hypothetical protein
VTRVICIVGAPRTGTHLVNSVICGSDAVLPMLSETTPAADIVEAFVSTAAHLERHPGVHFSDRSEVAALYGRQLGAFADGLCARYGREVCVLRAPRLAGSAAELRELLAAGGAQARIVCMVRDPRDVVASMRRWGRARVRAGGPPLVEDKDEIAAMSTWVTESYAALLGPGFDATRDDELLIIRYEDLVSEPGQCARELETFLELTLGDPRSGAGWAGAQVEFTRERLGESVTELFGRPVSGERVGAWGDVLSDLEAERVLTLCAPIVERFYRDAAAPDPTPPRAPARAADAARAGDPARAREPGRQEATLPRLRRFPYPFRAMLAISGNAERMTLERFRLVHGFLNTRAETPVGPGVGLDIADSMWVFGRAAPELALRYGLQAGGDQDAPGAKELAHYARSGWIDTLGSYGNFTVDGPPAFERRHAVAAIDALRGRELSLPVWVNYGPRSNVQNFGTRPFTTGDVPGAPEFHTDLLLEYGVRYAWNQSQGGIFGVEDPLVPMRLRDGRRIWGFRRYTTEIGPDAEEIAASHRIRLGRNERDAATCVLWWPELLPYQLSEPKLERLLERGHYAIIAQHLGELRDGEHFAPATVDAFRRLRALQDAGRLLVARVSRLLDYHRAAAHLEFQVRRTGRLDIDITAVRDPVIGTFVPSFEQLRGITFYVEDPGATTLFLNGRPIPKRELVVGASDGAARSIGIRWFDENATDHAASFAAGSAAAEAGRVVGDVALEPAHAD